MSIIYNFYLQRDLNVNNEVTFHIIILYTDAEQDLKYGTGGNQRLWYGGGKSPLKPGKSSLLRQAHNMLVALDGLILINDSIWSNNNLIVPFN